MLQAEEVAGAKEGASWFVSGKAQRLELEGVNEQLISSQIIVKTLVLTQRCCTLGNGHAPI